MKTFYWQCGHHSDHVGITKDGGPRTCPVCGKGFCMALHLTCPDCGRDMGFFRARRTEGRCPACKIDRSKVISKRKDQSISIQGQAIPERKSDCRHYQNECLPQAAFKNGKLDCRNCPRYESMESNVMAYASIRDSLSQTITHAMPRI